MQRNKSLEYYDVDFLLLSIIRQNSRKSIANMAAELNADASFLLKRLLFLEKRAILKYFSIIDFLKFWIRADFAVVPKKGKEKSIADFLNRSYAVNNAFRTDKGFYAECVFKSMKDLYSFFQQLSKLSLRVERHYVSYESRELFLPYPLISPDDKIIRYPKHMLF